MPGFNSKDSAGLDWGGFAPVSPEVENWKPDPDSIARPGSIPDPRFNRDPYEENRKAAYKKEFKTYSIPADVAASMVSGSPSPASRGANGWPAPEVRASGLPRNLVDANNSRVNSVASGSTSVTSPYGGATTSTPSKIRGDAPTKGTMETLPVTSHKYGKFKAPSVATSTTPSTSSSVPTPMAKTPLAGLAAVSIPPHLRKKGQGTDRGSELRLDPTAKSYFPIETAKVAPTMVKHSANEDTSEDTELAWKLATVELGLENAEEGLQLQKKMMDEYSVKPSKSPETVPPANSIPKTHCRQGNHGHWLKTRLVIIMEDDLDINNRATKRELMAMSDHDIDQYLQKVASAHEHWWEAEQRLYNHNVKESD